MKCVFNSNHATTVIRRREELCSQSVYLSTVIEAIGTVRVDPASFVINEARWEIYRSPDNALNEQVEVSELKGTEAFINAGQSLREVIGERSNGLPRELLAECVRGLIQAETFVYKERGYPSAEAYDEYWEGFDRDYCRYFSNLEKVEKPWREYIGDYERGSSLYNRIKSSQIWEYGDGKLLTFGSFVDSFHELSIQILVSTNGIIEECRGNFLRAPDRVCFENKDNLETLVGQDLIKLSKRDVGYKLGGSQGCYHLVDLVFDLSHAANHLERK